MPRIRVLLTAVLAAVLVSAPAWAATIFVATLTHAEETMQGQLVTDTGDPRPLSFGSATFVLNDAMTELSMSATISDIDVNGTQTTDTNDDLHAAHIHVGTPPGSNAPRLSGLSSLSGAPKKPHRTGRGAVRERRGWHLQGGRGHQATTRR